jgi:hypothetical protein
MYPLQRAQPVNADCGNGRHTERSPCRHNADIHYVFFFFCWIRTKSTNTEAITGLFYQPLMIDGDCGVTGEGMNDW